MLAIFVLRALLVWIWSIFYPKAARLSDASAAGGYASRESAVSVAHGKLCRRSRPRLSNDLHSLYRAPSARRQRVAVRIDRLEDQIEQRPRLFIVEVKVHFHPSFTIDRGDLFALAGQQLVQ